MLGNWIKQTSTTSGTGNLTLSSVTGFDTFTNQMGDATTNTPFRFFKYVVSDGNNWELGTGHMSTTTVLVRDIPEIKLSSGTLTRGGTALSLSGGTSTVFCDMTSEDFGFATVLNDTTNGVPFYRGGVSTQTLVLAANFVFAWPVYLMFGGLYSGIRHHCTTYGAGNKFQWGIYQADINGDVGNLLARINDITSGTGNVTTSWSTGTNVYFEKGWYWLVWSGNTAAQFQTRNVYGAHNFGPAGVDASGNGVSGTNGGAGMVNPLSAAGPFASMIFTNNSQVYPPDIELIHA